MTLNASIFYLLHKNIIHFYYTILVQFHGLFDSFSILSLSL